MSTKYEVPEIDWPRYDPAFICDYLAELITQVAKGAQVGTALSASRGKLDRLADADSFIAFYPKAAAKKPEVKAGDEKRAGYISGLRKVADLLEAEPDLPVPFHGAEGGPLTVYMLHSDRESFVSAVRALPGKADKQVTDDTYRVGVRLDGLGLEVVAYRSEVCERVVTGTREVTKTIPDPNAVVPTVEVTETVEDVEWICKPLLEGAKS